MLAGVLSCTEAFQFLMLCIVAVPSCFVVI